MRSLACACALLCILALDVNAQTRLGLVSSQLGVAPVPGGQFANNNIQNTPDCFCLPPNQLCPDVPPEELLRSTITQQSPVAGRCPDPEQQLCCPRPTSPGNVIPNPLPVRPVRPQPVRPNPLPVRPQPVRPAPIRVGACGVSNPIPYRRAAFAEAQFGEYPWMALVLDLGNRYLGGGVLISSEWVLTAAHKVHTVRSLKIRLGEHNVQTPQDHPQLSHLEVSVDNIIVHPQYNSESLANDIALLHLSQPVNTEAYPHIGTACLPEQGQAFFGQNCWVTGWGKDAFASRGSFQNILKEVDVPIVDPFACQERLRSSRLGPRFNLDTNSFVCAGGHQGKDACTGDGGAPLVCRTGRGWTVAGLVAWGIGCATSQMPGVYVNVASYSNFIRQYVRA